MMKFNTLILLVFCSFLFWSCIPNAQLNQDATILPRGMDQGTWTYTNNYPNWSCQSPWDSSCIPHGIDQTFQVTDNMIIGRTWNIGLADSLGIFPGMEMGYQVEIPHTIGFQLTLGQPSPWPELSHSLSIGWDLGMWADNTLWCSYAQEIELESHFSVGSQFRWLLNATQIGDLGYNIYAKDFLKSNQHPMEQYAINLKSLHWGQGWIPYGVQLQALWQSRIMPELGQSTLSGAYPSSFNHGVWILNVSVIWR